MKGKVLHALLTLCFLLSAAGAYRPPRVFGDELPLEKIALPPGFTIDLFAKDVPNARSMTLGEKGTLFVGTRKAGKVYAIRDLDGDGRADGVLTIAGGLNMPNGVAFREGSLFVACVDRLLRFEEIEERLKQPPAPTVISENLPGDRHHGWKFIRFGPDGYLYVPVGAPCNVCERDDKRYASILRFSPSGEMMEIFAHGVRNTVGFDWHPGTNELWFTDNGRDWMGDDLPPDELNRAAKKGLHFGFPYCHGGDVPDPKYGKQAKCSDFVPPELKLPAHVAALGMRFYRGNMFPEKYRGQIFIAEHGSWNRTVPTGYRITVVRLEENRVVDYSVFAQGWLEGGRPFGRPVDVLVMPDGSLLVSDDKAGVIYRIRFDG